MKKITIFLVAIICLTGIALYPQSLGDLARGEQARRDSISGGRVIIFESEPPELTDEEALTDDMENEEDDNAPGNPKKTKAGNDGESPEKNERYEITDLNGKNESYWRDAMTTVRDKIKQLEDEANELTSRRNALQLQHGRTNGSKRAPIKDEIDRTIQDLEQNKSVLEQTREELRNLQNEARSSAALPGWIE